MRSLAATATPEADDPPAKRAKLTHTNLEPTLPGEHLYVMAMSTDPTGAVHGLKVGRSSDIQKRAASLSDSMPFNISALATFTGAGHLERRVHSLLDNARNTTCRGGEGFHASLPRVLQPIACVMDRGRVIPLPTGTEWPSNHSDP